MAIRGRDSSERNYQSRYILEPKAGRVALLERVGDGGSGSRPDAVDEEACRRWRLMGKAAKVA